jgi:hypothetical protein
VTIPLSSSAVSEGIIISPSPELQLVFDASNWNTAQWVTVAGVDEDIPDGNAMYDIQLGVVESDDANYENQDPDDVHLVNVDDD